MNASLFISTTGTGLARAERSLSEEWRVESLLEDHKIQDLTTDPLNPGIVYAGTRSSGVLRSDDRGQTWHPAGLSGHVVKSLAVSPLEPGVVYAGTKPPMIFVSRDGGATWMELDSFRAMRRMSRR
jgi:photosystem II stability/assembly factor-like uncharacterized protein